jgi:iron complex transport system substrate-binding protein
MKDRNTLRFGWLTLVACALLFGSTMAWSADHRELTDFRGKSVKVPRIVKRVVTIDDGLSEGILTILGESDKIVGLGSKSLRKTSSFTIPNAFGPDFSYKDCMNPVRYLNPGFADLPLIKDKAGINFESLASLSPDLVIIRTGSCSASFGVSGQAFEKNIDVIESLGIPVITLMAPPCSAEPTLDNISKEIRLLGRIFDKEAKAAEVADELQGWVEEIRKRTHDIPGDQKPRLLALGLSPQARNEGGAGNVRSGILKYYIEDVVNARSAFTVTYHTPDTGLISAEQVFAMDPDVLILTTSFGYHPPEELYNAPYYQVFKDLRAVKKQRVSALPFTPANCDASRIEFPIDLMVIAKTAYPEKFKDIKVNQWVLDFYQAVYGVDHETALRLRTAQLLDWTVSAQF